MAGLSEQYYVFGDDHLIYGPAAISLVQEWGREGCISARSWIYNEAKDEWRQAGEMPDVKSFVAEGPKLETTPAAEIRPGQLRRMILFADMTDEQLRQFVGLLEKVHVPSFKTVIKKGEHGDAMFLVLAGEARVVDRVDDTEQTLHTLEVGDFSGEISLFAQGPRTADVITNKESTFLKISKAVFQKLISDHPDLATAFLTSLARFMAARLRSTNKMYSASLLFKRAGEGRIKSPFGG